MLPQIILVRACGCDDDSVSMVLVWRMGGHGDNDDENDANGLE